VSNVFIVPVWNVNFEGWGVSNGPRLIISISSVAPVRRLKCVDWARKELVVGVWGYWQY